MLKFILLNCTILSLLLAFKVSAVIDKAHYPAPYQITCTQTACILQDDKLAPYLMLSNNPTSGTYIFSLAWYTPGGKPNFIYKDKNGHALTLSFAYSGMQVYLNDSTWVADQGSYICRQNTKSSRGCSITNLPYLKVTH